MRVLLATRNAGKVAELRRILAGTAAVELVGLILVMLFPAIALWLPNLLF
jgi:inosine/xanthosine triphosphate pyrophosphatase family protein